MHYYPTKNNLDNIFSFINEYDNIKILNGLQQFTVVNQNLEYDRLLDSGAILFLTGIMLKRKKDNLKEPSYQVICNLKKTLLAYYDHYYFESIDNIKNEPIDDLDKEFKFKLWNFNLLNKVNYGGHQFQYDEYGKNVFGQLDSFFEQKIGFTFSDAMEYIEKIQSYFTSSLERIIDPDKFSKEHVLSDDKINIFIKFLDFLSVEFGEQYPDFNNPSDKNILFEKPIIKTNGFYYCPSIQLLWDHHVYFSTMLKAELINNTQIGKRYKKLKSDYLEDKTVEFLKRIFPPNNVYCNLYYYPKNTVQTETDVLVQHGNVILIFEAKTGELSDPALRGAPKSLLNDFTKLIGKAYSQGKRTSDFILNEEHANFYDKKKKHLLCQINKGSRKINFVKCSITLYPLRALATNIEDLNTLNLFPEGEHPLYLSIFDLDILTRFITNGSILIDYLNKRIQHRNNNPFASSEIEFLYNYLESQSFKDIPKINPKELHDPFDSFFILGKDKPVLKINNEIYDLLVAIDNSQIDEKVEIIQRILSLKKVKLQEFSKNMQKKIKKSSKNSLNSIQLFKIPQYTIEINIFVSYKPDDKKLKRQPDISNNNYITNNRINIDFDVSAKKYVKVYTKE